MTKTIREQMRDLRRDFTYGTLDPKEAPSNPFDFLKQWLDEAVQSELKDANAFMLSTENEGWPDARILLIRDIVDNGFHFYTNYTSKKAKDIEQNPKAMATLFWPELDRQIRMRIELTKLSETLSDDYFTTRPRASQIGAWASKQSTELESRAHLEERIAEIEKQFEGKEVTRPDFWGGYLAKVIDFEFWQGRPNRLHDRIKYNRQERNWEIVRLYP